MIALLPGPTLQLVPLVHAGINSMLVCLLSQALCMVFATLSHILSGAFKVCPDFSSCLYALCILHITACCKVSENLLGKFACVRIFINIIIRSSSS